MAGQDAQDRRLPASGRKIHRARERGQVPRSRDLGHLSAVLCVGAFLFTAGPLFSRRLMDMLAHTYSFDTHVLTGTDWIMTRIVDMIGLLVGWVVALGAVTLFSAWASATLSGGWNWTLQPLKPNFGKFNPLTGLMGLFSKQQIIDTLKATVLAVSLGTVGCWYLAHHWSDFVLAGRTDLSDAIASVASQIVHGVGALLLVLTLFALVDTPLQRFLYLERLKMNRQEVKDEQRELEGNMEVKGKVKALMRERVRRRMLAAVPKADLVVMNPTHYAVALKYDEATMGAPRVVAKGADLLALAIRDAANEHKVPVLEAPVLARALYAHAELDREIPLALYSAVAQVLAWVYQLRDAMRGRAPMPGRLPDLPVPPELDPHNAKPLDDHEDDE